MAWVVSSQLVSDMLIAAIWWKALPNISFLSDCGCLIISLVWASLSLLKTASFIPALKQGREAKVRRGWARVSIFWLDWSLHREKHWRIQVQDLWLGRIWYSDAFSPLLWLCHVACHDEATWHSFSRIRGLVAIVGYSSVPSGFSTLNWISTSKSSWAFQPCSRGI